MENKYLERHISQSFDEELETIKSQILELGGIVEQQILDSVDSIVTVDGALANKVIAIEDDVDEREVRL